ncbi:TetR family transcriptional regulator [Streptomyces sp. SID6013]|nr:TetR family transcriptional regulator [Streptomyces sp. SID6013]
MNQDLILDAAFALVERGGSEALTLRRLGADLGANHTAVPRHFSSKDETPRGLADRLIARAMEDFVPAGGWREMLETLACRMRTVCVAHPRVAVLVATRIARREVEFHGADVVIGLCAPPVSMTPTRSATTAPWSTRFWPWPLTSTGSRTRRTWSTRSSPECWLRCSSRHSAGWCRPGSRTGTAQWRWRPSTALRPSSPHSPDPGGRRERRTFPVSSHRSLKPA